MHFLVVGPGAMGTLFSVRLSQAGHQVTLLDYKAKRAESIGKEGLRLEGVTGEVSVHVPVVTTPTPAPVDVVLICVKATQTLTAARDIAGRLPPQANILTLQNGLGNVEILQEVFGEDRVFGGVTSEGATLMAPGHARHAGRGETFIGPAGPAQDREDAVKSMVSAFREAGFDTRSTNEVEGLIWGKLIVNVGINALTALTRLKNGRLPEISGTHMLMEKAVEEAVQVARARGIALPYPEPLERVVTVCRATADNVASMLQDILAEKPTEVAFINGAVVREGEKQGIATPVNFTLSCLVEALQETYDQRVNP
ncbi:MAG: ketopantoate reductase family protein [Desulfobacteraceae bacterium]